MNRPRPRMADYFALLDAFASETADAFVDTHRASMAEAAENDPFVLDTVAFMETRPNFTGNLDDAKNVVVPSYDTRREMWTITGTASQLYPAALAVHDLRHVRGSFFPSSPAKWSGTLAETGEALRAMGITVERKKIRGTKLLTLCHRPPQQQGADRGAATSSEGAASRPEGADTPSTIGPLETPGQDPFGPVGGRGGSMLRGFSTYTFEEEKEGVGRGKEVPATIGPLDTPAAAADGGVHAPWPNPWGLDWHDESGRVLSVVSWLRRIVENSPRDAKLLSLEYWLDDEDSDPDSRLSENMSGSELLTYMHEETPADVLIRLEPTVNELLGIESEEDEYV